MKTLAGKNTRINIPDQIVVGDQVVTGNQNMSHCVNHFFPPEPPSLESHRATEKLTESILLNSFISCAPPVTYSELSTAVESLVIMLPRVWTVYPPPSLNLVFLKSWWFFCSS